MFVFPLGFYWVYFMCDTIKSMTGLKIKPLSVNEAYRGRRFISDKYHKYKRDVALILPKNLKIPDGPLEIYFRFGVARLNCDVDNPVKPFLDILQAQYLFNDSRVQKIITEKEKVKTGEEYIIFDITPYQQNFLLNKRNCFTI